MSKSQPSDGRVQVRVACPEDARAIARIHGRSLQETYTRYPITHRVAATGLTSRETLWSGLLEHGDDRKTLVACEGERVLGFAHLGQSRDEDEDPLEVGEISSIHVDPEVTGTGTGTHLMRVALAHLADAGHRTVTLWVVEDNHHARNFYEGLGFGVDGARRREKLAVGNEDGDIVEVVRYRREIG